jgi:hypothetical protein
MYWTPDLHNMDSSEGPRKTLQPTREMYWSKIQSRLLEIYTAIQLNAGLPALLCSSCSLRDFCLVTHHPRCSILYGYVRSACTSMYNQNEVSCNQTAA